MAQEGKRGCGFRKVGSMYLVGGFYPVECDRLPYPLDVCPTCGGGILVSRAFTKISPLTLFGNHQDCLDQHHPCRLCDPTSDIAFIMRVGQLYYPTPGHFVAEGMDMGISKKIPWIPRELELGKTHIFLAHPKACEVRLEPAAAVQEAEAIVHGEGTSQVRLLDAEKVEYRMGIFAAFTPRAVEKLIWKHQATDEELKSLGERGITAVIIENGDMDHSKGVKK